MGYNIAIAGATGNVGRELMQILAERNFPADNIYALASSRSVGKEVSYGEDKTISVEDMEHFDFSKVDLVFSSPGGKVSEKFSPKAAAAGAVVIDNTSVFRMDPDIPLVVPEVNPEALDGYNKKNIIANPNCSTIQMMVALKPIHAKFNIKRIVVSTYQSVSGGGKEAMDELFRQTRGIYVNEPVEKECFTKQIAFNCIPHIDTFMDDGFTKEEWKMMVETKKILDPNIEVVATCVRVPVFVSHSESITIETEHPIHEKSARDAWTNADGIVVVDHRQDEGYVTPVEAAGEDATYISRIRKDPTVKNGLTFWCVSDNLRKGAALNTVQIAEHLIKNQMKK